MSAQTFEVEIERMLPGGVGLAHASGMTLFVSLSAPGDTVRVKVDRVRGNIGFATVVEVVKPSLLRVEPPCPYFGRCGGCDFQQLTYEAQLASKVEIIRDSLHRIAKIEPLPDVPIHPSPNPWHYRARAMWQVDEQQKQLGYFERGTNRVCDVEYCAVLTPALQQTLEQVRTEFKADDSPHELTDIEVVEGDEGISISPPSAGVQTNDVSRAIGNERYQFSAEAFFQVNHSLLEPLVSEALRFTDEEELEGTALDLYCGVGLFTLPLMRRFKKVTGIESSFRSAEFARRNVALRGSSPTVREGVKPAQSPKSKAQSPVAQVEIVSALVGDWMREHSRSFGPVDFLLLDPPRTGAENIVIAGIIALSPSRITYVSCDPATLARDLKKLVAAEYTLEGITAFDMFPQTHHVETVVHLSKF